MIEFQDDPGASWEASQSYGKHSWAHAGFFKMWNIKMAWIRPLDLAELVFGGYDSDLYNFFSQPMSWQAYKLCEARTCEGDMDTTMNLLKPVVGGSVQFVGC
jgi:hypothetical protein